MTNDIHIRSTWQASDEDLIVDLHRQGYAHEGAKFTATFPAYVRETVRQAALGTPGNNSLVFFAERGRDTLGCAAMIDRQTSGQLRWVILRPEARGLGLGKRLLNACLAHAESNKWPYVWLETTDGLAVSTNLYKTNGFRVTSDTIADLWDGPGRLIIMRKDLAANA